MKNKLTIKTCLKLSLILVLFFTEFISAQEFAIPNDNNALLSELKNKRNKAGNVTDTLDLPFFDDFSDSYYHPNPNLWTDNHVFINNNYAVSPPSIGVATLDAIDNTGKFYEGAGYGNSFFADELSSQAINLNYPGNTTIYLSFYFQPQGLGDLPEVGDSLVLQFFAPEDSVWSTVWAKEGSVLAGFEQAIIPVNKAEHLKEGFRFRFRNRVSLSGDNNQSLVVNVDHWHIDYVYLDVNRSSSDLNYHDIAFIYPMKSHLKNYESMPWKHYKVNPGVELATNVDVIYKNNDNVTRLIDSIYFVFDDNSGTEVNDTLFGGSYDIEAGLEKQFNPPFTYPFISNSTDSASFNVKARFITDGFDPVVNNEISYVQKFYDYYAYDDGSAEAGYGLTGEGTQNAQLAYKFDCRKEDTLKAIQMYFNRSLLDKNRKYFYLTIWDDDGGEPGQIIYQREGERPEFEDELNKFHTYYIDDTTLVLNNEFYVGWVQTTSDFLNVGLDFNRVHNENIFYNINGSWKNSKFEASLMIRTFFGKKLTLSHVPVEKTHNSPGVKVFPNPTSDQITILVNNSFKFEQITVNIYSLSGRLVHQSIHNNNSPINISKLKEGIYLLRLNDKKHSFNYTQKLVKIRN